MTFIITLIALIIERYFHWTQLRDWNWFDRYQAWVAKKITFSSYVVIAVCILPLLLIVSLLDGLFSHVLYGAVQLVFGCIILLYCMGPNNLWVQVYSSLSALQRNDPKEAIAHAQSAFGIVMPSDSQAFHQSLTRAIFIEANQGLFAVLFWFMVLGPVGAVLYRLAALMGKQSTSRSAFVALQLQQILDWIPVRLFTFVFALGGHFTEVYACWRRNLKKGNDANQTLLTECGMAALDTRERSFSTDGTTEHLALQLVDRVLMMWLVLLAAIVLIVK